MPDDVPMADQQSGNRTGPDGESGEHRVPPPPRPEDRIPGQPVSRPSRWSGIGPGSRPLLFATVVAAIYATVILLVASVGLVFNTDDGGSWAELVGAVVGNFILVWVVMVGLSLVVRLFRRKD